MIDFAELRQYVIDGDRDAAVPLTRRAIEAGVAADLILKDALVPAMDRVGELMRAHEYFLPEVLLSARAMQACNALLRPLIAADPGMKPIGKAVACTVAGDLHDIGKNLVCMMLEGAGFGVIDLGANCSAERIIAMVRTERPDVVAMSAMLTTTMLQMPRVIQELGAAGLRDRVHVMVGGAAVSADFAQEIGADYYDNQAAGASAHARRYVETLRR